MVSPKLSTWLWCLGLALFVTICWGSLNKPLASDEAVLGSAARCIALYGKPIYYDGDIPESYVRDEDRWMVPDMPLPGYKYALWHSPLNIYGIAISYKIFGVHDWSGRLPGALCVLLSLAALAGILKEQAAAVGYNSEQARAVGGYLAILYFASPFLIQQGLTPDIDNSVMTTGSLIFLYLYLKLRREDRIVSPALLSVLFALCFWTKEYAPGYLVASAGVYELLQRRWGNLRTVCTSFVAGIALIVISWWLYCYLFSLPLYYPIVHSYIGRVENNGSLVEHWRHGGFPQALWILGTTWALSLCWSSVFQLVLSLAAVGYRVAHYLRHKCLQPLDLPVIYSLGVLAATKFLRPSPISVKYEYPAYAPLVLAVAFMIYQELGPLTWRALGRSLLLLVPLVVLNVVLFGDPVWRLLRQGTAWNYLGASTLLGVLTLVVTRIAVSSHRRAVVAALVLSLLGANLALDWIQRRPYLTTANWNFDYGSQGLGQIGEKLQQSGVLGTYPALSKDVGFHASVQLNQPDFHWLDLSVLADSAEEGPAAFDKVLLPNIHHVVVLDRQLSQAFGENLKRRGFHLQARVGDYLLLQRGPEGCREGLKVAERP